MLKMAIKTGLSIEEYLNMSPREFQITLEAHEELLREKQERLVTNAWLSVAYDRSKTLPKLDKILNDLNGKKTETKTINYQKIERIAKQKGLIIPRKFMEEKGKTMANVGNVSVDVTANTQRFMTGMSNVQNKLKNVGQSFVSVGTKMSLGITVPLMAIGGIALKSAMDLEATGTKFETVFEGMTDEATKFIKKFQELTPATQSGARDMATGIQDLLIPMGFAREEATGMTGAFMHVAGALTNFNSSSKSTQDVVNAIQSGITGMYRPLASLGVQLNKTTIKEKALEMGIIDGSEQITKQQEVLVMLSEIYKQSGDALNGYTEESLDAGTRMALLKNKVTDLFAELFIKLLPTFHKLIDKLNVIVDVFAKLDPKIQIAIGVIALLIGAIGPLILVFGLLLTAVATVISAIGVIGPVIAGLGAPFFIAIGAVIALIGILALLVTTFVVLYNKNEKFRNAVIKIWDNLKEATISILKNMYTGFKVIFTDITKKVMISIDIIVGSFKILSTAIRNTTSALKKVMKGDFVGAFQDSQKMTKGIFENTMKTLQNIGKRDGKFIISALEDGIDTIKNVDWKDKFSKVLFGKNTLNDLKKEAENTGEKSIEELIKALMDSMKKNTPSVKATAGETGEVIGEEVVEKTAESIQRNNHVVSDAMENMLERTKTTIDRVGGYIVTALRNRYQKEETMQLGSLQKQLDQLRTITQLKIREHEKELDSKLYLLDEETKLQLKGKQNQIDNLNRKTEAEEKTIKEQQYFQKLSEKKSQLSLEESEEKKAKIQKEIDDMMARRKREQLIESRRKQTEHLRNEMQLIRDSADEKREALQKEYKLKIQNTRNLSAMNAEYYKKQIENTKAHYQELLKEENLQSEARKMMMYKSNDEIVSLLNEYNPKWRTVGKSLSENLLDGLNDKKEDIRATINDMLSMMKQLQSYEKQKQNVTSLFMPNNQPKSSKKSTTSNDFFGSKSSDAFSGNTKSSSRWIGGSFKSIASYDVGTNYVPKDMIAMLHKGESVIPAKYNDDKNKSVTVNVTGNTISNNMDVEVIGDSIVRKLRMAGVS